MRTTIVLLLCFLGCSESSSAVVTAADDGDARAMNRRRLRKESEINSASETGGSKTVESETVKSEMVEEPDFFVSTGTAPFASNDFDGHFDVSKESELAQFVVQSIRAALPTPNLASNDLETPQNFTSDGSNSPSSQPTLHSLNTLATNGEEPVSFTGIVWHDVNDNGRRDDNEVGLAGYLVQVKACATEQTDDDGLVDNDVLVAFAFSAVDGSYQLIDFGPPGCYYVHLVRSDMTGGGMSQNFVLESGGRVKLNAGIVLPTPTTMSPIVASSAPTILPSQAPITMEPTEEPSNSPITVQPSISPTTDEPSASPITSEPTMIPSFHPTTRKPSNNPTMIPSFPPTTSKPSKKPTTDNPTLMPSRSPTSDEPSASPTSIEPTMIPSFTPSTNKPSKKPETYNPTLMPSKSLIMDVSSASSTSGEPTTISSTSQAMDGEPGPTMSKPTSSPLSKPRISAQTTKPSSKLTATPTFITIVATTNPTTSKPTTSPSSEPTRTPSLTPITTKPTTSPSSEPSSAPTTTPSLIPITTKPTVTPTLSPSISHQPFRMPSVGPTISLGPSITDTNNSPRPSSTPTSKPVTPKPTSSPSYRPTTLTPTSITTSLVTSQPTESNPTSLPTLASTSTEPTIISSTTLVASQTLKPTATPITTTTPPTEKPAGRPSLSPTLSTNEPTKQPHQAYVSKLPDFIKVTVIETEGELSMDATLDLNSALDTFFGSKLMDYYNGDGEYFQSIHFIPTNQRSIERQIREEPVRNLRSVVKRRLEGVIGTEILCHGRIEFIGKPPSSNEITDVITSIGKEYNQELVSAIVDTKSAELSQVYIVSVEKNVDFDDEYTRMPSSSPSIWTGTYPDEAQSLEQEARTTDLMAYAIMWSAMFATLTLLIFMFVNRRRADRRATHHARISTDRSALSDVDDIDDNEGSNLSVLSSVTDLNEYVHSAPADGKQLHSDKWRRSSAAELNGRGTMTLQRDDSSVMPTSWLAALESGNSPRFDSDSSTDETQYSRGGFPRVSANILRELRIEKDELLRQSNETIDVARILRKSKSAEKEVISDKSKSWRLSNMISVVSPRSNTERNVANDSDSSVDNAKSVYDERDTSTEAYSEASSRNYREGAFPSTTTTGFGLDWSYIGTVDEENTKEHDDIEQQEEDQSKSESKSSSLNRFISDLVWLEERIADQSGKAASKAGSLKNLSKHDDIQRSDSLSYKCDSFDSRSLSEYEVTAAPSVIVNDCYIPPGEIGIEVASTKDGPVISCITDISLEGHLNVGDLIMALDDRDTRSLSGEQLWSDLQTRNDFQRKLTLLHYGGMKTSDVKYMYA